MRARLEEICRVYPAHMVEEDNGAPVLCGTGTLAAVLKAGRDKTARRII